LPLLWSTLQLGLLLYTGSGFEEIIIYNRIYIVKIKNWS
jgi:hypothetical protein